MDTRGTRRRAAPRPPRDRGVLCAKMFSLLCRLLPDAAFADRLPSMVARPADGGFALSAPYGSGFVGESGMLCLTRIRPGAAAVAALLCLGVGAAAQQLPPAPG